MPQKMKTVKDGKDAKKNNYANFPKAIIINTITIYGHNMYFHANRFYMVFFWFLFFFFGFFFFFLCCLFFFFWLLFSVVFIFASKKFLIRTVSHEPLIYRATKSRDFILGLWFT